MIVKYYIIRFIQGNKEFYLNYKKFSSGKFGFVSALSRRRDWEVGWYKGGISR